jgi:hypothetical protein
MRFTRSQARSQAAEEAQALLLSIASQPPPPEDSPPLQTILKDVPLELTIPHRVSIQTTAIPSAPSFRRKRTRLPPTGVLGLPIPGLKRRQERYGVALCVQCLTLFDAGIPLDVICSRWLVTKSAIHR